MGTYPKITEKQPPMFEDAFPKNLSASEVELKFVKLLAARLVRYCDGTADYFSDADKEAIDLFRKIYPTDVVEIDLEVIALEAWERIHPGYKYGK